MVNVLNERLHLLSDRSLTGRLTRLLPTRHLIARQRFLQYRHQWSIARKEHRVRGLLCPAMARRHIETNESLAGTWDARDEHDGLLTRCPCLLNHVFDPTRRNTKISSSS